MRERLIQLDPRTSLLALVSLAVWVGSTQTLIGASIWVALLSIMSAALIRGRSAGVSIPRGWPAMLGFMVLLTLVLYLVFPPPSVSPTAARSAAIVLGLRMAMRLVALALLAALSLSIVSPMRLAAGLTRLLVPLRRMGLRVESVFYFVFFLLRMAPLLIDESRLIRLAQRSRGIRFDGAPWRRWRASRALILPVFAAGIRRSEQLALSLAARGFEVGHLPAMVTSLRFSALDWLAEGMLLVGWAVWLVPRLA